MSSATAEWSTPPHVLEVAARMLGGAIDLDPCADAARTVPAARHYGIEDDGLSRAWDGRVFMNPPYGSETPRWVEKLLDEHAAGRTTAAVVLVASRTDTSWFQSLLRTAACVCLVAGRLNFGASVSSATFPSALLYIGPEVRTAGDGARRVGFVCVTG